MSNVGERDDGYTGNHEVDQAVWDLCTKGGYDYGGYEDEHFEADQRARVYRRKLKALLAKASPQQRAALEAGLAQLKAQLATTVPTLVTAGT